jgi:putative transposase
VPRDRAGTFEPLLIPRNTRRLPRFDQNVLFLYARVMIVMEIQEQLEELYQVSTRSMSPRR